MLSAQLLPMLAALLFAGSAEATVFNVTTPADSIDGACTPSKCSLRDAVIASNAVSGPNTINLRTGHYRLTIAGANEQAAASGDLNITKSVTIHGPGASGSTIRRNRHRPDL